MAKIISMSLNDKILEEIDSLSKEMGFSGRSETIRAGIRLLSADYKEHAKLAGNINAVLSLVHKKSKEIGAITHKFPVIIKTHLHNHIDNDRCLDVFVLNGDAKLIIKLAEDFQKDKNIGHLKLTIC